MRGEVQLLHPLFADIKLDEEYKVKSRKKNIKMFSFTVSKMSHYVLTLT